MRCGSATSPLPSFTHLAALGAALPAIGVNTLITLPLYAAFLDEPFDPSPYAPVSRLHWNEVYLDDAALPAAPVPHLGALIDWRTLGRRRRQQLLDAVAQLPGELAGRRAALGRGQSRRRRLRRGSAPRSPSTRPTPLVPATSSRPATSSPSTSPTSPSRDCTNREPRRSPSTCRSAAIRSGSRPGRTPTCSPPGWASARRPTRCTPTGRTGGSRRSCPGAAERSGFALWRHVVRRCGQYASLLRIDHVLGVHRLWWIPDGMEPARACTCATPVRSCSP